MARSRLPRMSSFRGEYLCNKNAVTHNPVKGVERPKIESGEGKTPAIADHQARKLLEAGNRPETRASNISRTQRGLGGSTIRHRWRRWRRYSHSAQSPARAFNGQRLHLRPSLARSTISESRDTKCEVDQGREIAKIGASSFLKATRQWRQSHLSLAAWSGWSGRIESPRTRLAEQGQRDSLR